MKNKACMCFQQPQKRAVPKITTHPSQTCSYGSDNAWQCIIQNPWWGKQGMLTSETILPKLFCLNNPLIALTFTEQTVNAKTWCKSCSSVSVLETG